MSKIRRSDPDLRLEALRLAVQSSAPDTQFDELTGKAERFIDFVTPPDEIRVEISIDAGPRKTVQLPVESSSGADIPFSVSPTSLSENAEKFLRAAIKYCDRHSGIASMKQIRAHSGVPAGSINHTMRSLQDLGYIAIVSMGGPIHKIRVLQLADGTAFTGGTWNENGITKCPTVRATGSVYSEELGRQI